MSLAKEKKLSAKERGDIVAVVGTTMTELSLGYELAPHHILEEIERHVKRWHTAVHALQRFTARHKHDPEIFARRLGILWGQQLVYRFGWEWSHVEGDHGVHLSVVSPDRSLALHPVRAVREALGDMRKQLHAVRIYGLLEGGHAPALPPGCLEDMHRELTVVAE